MTVAWWTATLEILDLGHFRAKQLRCPGCPWKLSFLPAKHELCLEMGALAGISLFAAAQRELQA